MTSKDYRIDKDMFLGAMENLYMRTQATWYAEGYKSGKADAINKILKQIDAILADTHALDDIEELGDNATNIGIAHGIDMVRRRVEEMKGGGAK